MSRGSLVHPLALTGISLLIVLSAPAALHAEPDRPDPPRSRVKIYDADPLTCRPEVIEAGFRTHMAPWADQPEAVQQRLRILLVGPGSHVGAEAGLDHLRPTGEGISVVDLHP